MSRSLRIHPDYIHKVKLAVKRNGYPRQKDLAEDLQISLATVSNYLNGKPVDYLNFLEISTSLGQEWKAIASFSEEINDTRKTKGDQESEGSTCVSFVFRFALQGTLIFHVRQIVIAASKLRE